MGHQRPEGLHSLEAKLVGGAPTQVDLAPGCFELHSLEAKLVGCDCIPAEMLSGVGELHSLEAKLVGCDVSVAVACEVCARVAQPGSQTGRL